MFDNLIEILNAQLPFSDETTKLMESVERAPNLSYFGEKSSIILSNTEKECDKSSLADQELDKASLLRLLRTAVLCPSKNQHSSLCKNLINSVNTSNSLSTLLSQFSDFQYIVVAETIIALHTYDFAALKDPEYATNLVKIANMAPNYIRPLFCFALFQLLGFRQKVGASSPNIEPPIKTLPDSARDILTKKIFSPILLASFCNNEGSAVVTKILKQFDVFDIIHTKWLIHASKILDREVYNICLNEISYFLIIFLRLFIKSLMSQSPTTVTTRILPLMSRIVNHSPPLFQKFLDECNIFNNKHITETCFSSLLQLVSCSCNSKRNSLIILKNFTDCRSRSEPLINEFFNTLRFAHSDVVSRKVSESSKSAMYLIKRLVKYLPEEQKGQLIDMFCGSDTDSPIDSFTAFLWDLMDNIELAPFAAQTLKILSYEYPDSVLRLFDDSANFSNIDKMMENETSVHMSFICIARSLVSFAFCRTQPVPLFAKYLINYLPDLVFKKFERRSNRWSTLIAIVELALDISYCDLQFCSEIQNDQNVSRSLVSIVRQTADIIGIPPAIIKESENVRLDSDKVRIIIQFDCVALTFMARLCSYNLMNDKKLSFLCTSFFTDNSDASSLFSTFVSFLKLTHPLTSQLRFYAIQMIDIMCEIAGRMPNISVDSFYPHESQSILIESVRTNLFKSDDITQTINELDFIAHALSSQLAFANSFVRQLGSSFVAAATKKLKDIADQFPDLLLSLSRMLSMMIQNLSPESKAISQITTQQTFYQFLWKIIESPPKDDNVCEIMASKAELLNIAILDGQNIEFKIIKTLLNQVRTVLPKKFDPIYTEQKLDMNRFVNAKLHRVYGDEYIIDTELLKRYLVTDEIVVEKARSLNNNLSIVDACTQVLSSICSFLKITANSSLFPPIEDALELVVFVLNSDIYPDSTAEVAFNILDICLSAKDSPINGIESKFLRGLTFYLMKRPLVSTFNIIAKLLSVSEVENSEELRKMLDPCIDYALLHTESASSLECASEIALKLTTFDNWIVDSPKCANCFFRLLPTPLGNSVVDFMTIILMNPANAITLEHHGFFEQLISIDCNDDAKSPLWPKLFTMMTAIPFSSKTAFHFFSTHLGQIAFFLNQVALESIKPGQLYKIQASITELLVHIAPNIKQFAEENPTQYDMIINLLSGKLRASLLFLRESPHLKLIGQIYDHDSHNEKVCNLFILRNSLLFFNKLFDFPTGQPAIDAPTSNAVIDLMEKIADGLQNILSTDASAFSGICLQSFEYTLRIFVAKALAAMGTAEGRQKLKEVRNSILRSINSVQTSIKKYSISNAQDSLTLLDEMNNYLCSLI